MALSRVHTSAKAADPTKFLLIKECTIEQTQVFGYDSPHLCCYLNQNPHAV